MHSILQLYVSRLEDNLSYRFAVPRSRQAPCQPSFYCANRHALVLVALALAALALALALATARGAHAAALALAIAPRRRRRMLWVERARGKSRIAHTRLYTNPAHMRRPTRASHAPSLARALFHSLDAPSPRTHASLSVSIEQRSIQ